MTGATLNLAVAGLALLAVHFGLSSTGLRERLAEKLGESTYLGLYSLIAAAQFAWLIWAYVTASPGLLLWSAYPWGNYLTIALMPLSLLLLVGGVTMRNPTAVGGHGQLDDPVPARGVLRITRNPVMWGIGIWALGHLIANGDAASVLFFGTLAVLALLGSMLIDLKHRTRKGAKFASFELATSNLPFLAMIQGRQSLGAAMKEFGVARLALVVVLYAVLLHGHAWVLGVSPIPG